MSRWNDDAHAATISATFASPGWYNVDDYGADPTGLTDSTEAIQLALAAAPRGATIFLPGEYRCDADLHVYRQLYFVGTSGGFDEPASRIHFAPGMKLRVWQLGSPFGGNGAEARFSNFEISSTPLTMSAPLGRRELLPWEEDHDYAVGDVVRIVGKNYAYLECIKAGRSSRAIAPEVTFQDDPTAYASRSPATDSTSACFRIHRTYFPGQLVRGTTDGAPVRRDGSNLITSVYFMVDPFAAETGVSSGSSYPTWSLTPFSTTIVNGVEYTALPAAVPELVPGASYVVGDVVYGSTDGRPVREDKRNKTSSWFIVRRATGPAGDRPRTWNENGKSTVTGGVTFEPLLFESPFVYDGAPDGSGVVWANRVHSGLYIGARAHVDNVYVRGFTNAGIVIRAVAGFPSQSANGSTCTNVRSIQNGIGLMIAGGDTNGCLFSHCYVRSAGYPYRNVAAGGTQPDHTQVDDRDGGVGCFDASFLDSTWISCEVANAAKWVSGIDYGGGPAYLTCGGSRSLFVYCHSEPWAPDHPEYEGSRTAPIFEPPAVVISGAFGHRHVAA
jgi:hypothetical protein